MTTTDHVTTNLIKDISLANDSSKGTEGDIDNEPQPRSTPQCIQNQSVQSINSTNQTIVHTSIMQTLINSAHLHLQPTAPCMLATQELSAEVTARVNAGQSPPPSFYRSAFPKHTSFETHRLTSQQWLPLEIRIGMSPSVQYPWTRLSSSVTTATTFAKTASSSRMNTEIMRSMPLPLLNSSPPKSKNSPRTDGRFSAKFVFFHILSI